MRSTLTSGAVCGTKTVAWMSRSRAAKACASPALPPEATTMPASPISPDLRPASWRLKAPRVLKTPQCWRNSHLSHTASRSDGRIKGVRRTRPAIRSAAACTSPLLTITSGLSAHLTATAHRPRRTVAHRGVRAAAGPARSSRQWGVPRRRSPPLRRCLGSPRIPTGDSWARGVRNGRASQPTKEQTCLMTPRRPRNWSRR